MEKIHKADYSRKVEIYIGLSQYKLINPPLCVGSKMLYRGYSYIVSRTWRNVTCKHCLKNKIDKQP